MASMEYTFHPPNKTKTPHTDLNSPVHSVAPHLTPVFHRTLLKNSTLLDIEFVTRRHRLSMYLALTLPSLSLLAIRDTAKAIPPLIASLLLSSTISFIGYDSYFDEQGLEKRDVSDRTVQMWKSAYFPFSGLFISLF